MSQLQRDTACRQPPWQDQSAGSGCCPGDDGPGREAGRSPGAVLSIHGGSGAAATGPGEASGGGGKGTGPGPRYSQEIAAHGGGDQHRDDHPAETPPLTQEGPVPEPPTAVPPEPPLTRGSAPWARTRGRRCPRGPRRRRRGRAAARSCAPSWPLRTGHGPAHCRAAPPIGGRSAPHCRHRRFPLAESFGSARPGPAPIGPARGPRLPAHLAPQRSTQPHAADSQNSFMLQSSHSHPPPPPPPPAPARLGAHRPAQPGVGGSAAPGSGGAAPREGSPAGALLGNSPQLAHEPQCHAEQGQGARLVRSSQRRRDIKQQGADAQAHLPRREKR